MKARSLNLPRPLSYSSISLYAECPQKYKFRYLDRIPEKPKHYFSFGSSVHTALEFFYGVKAPPPPTLDQVLAYYKEHWISAGYKDAAQEAEYRQDGEEILAKFHQKHAADYHIPLFVEYQFNMLVEGVPVTGKVDRIDKLPDGTFSVVDYKTGKALAQDRVATDEQLTMYQLACENLLGGKVSRLSFYHVPSLTEHVSNRRGENVVEGFTQKIVTTAEAVSSGKFTPTPTEKKCFWCDYKPICPIYKAQTNDAPAAAKGEDFSADLEISTLIDRYGNARRQSQELDQEAEKIKNEIISLFEKKNYIRAFGKKYEVTRTLSERWKFPDKKKFLDFLRATGLYERILAPSAPKIRDLLEDNNLPPETSKNLKALAEKIETSELKVQPL